jgi:hypothetical protein
LAAIAFDDEQSSLSAGVPNRRALSGHSAVDTVKRPALTASVYELPLRCHCMKPRGKKSRLAVPEATHVPTDSGGRTAAVLDSFEDNCAFYQREVRKDHALYVILTVATLVGTALTPVLY